MSEKWKPVMNPDYNVVSGKAGNLSKDSSGLVTPLKPTVFSSPDSEPF